MNETGESSSKRFKYEMDENKCVHIVESQWCGWSKYFPWKYSVNVSKLNHFHLRSSFI